MPAPVFCDNLHQHSQTGPATCKQRFIFSEMLTPDALLMLLAFAGPSSMYIASSAIKQALLQSSSPATLPQAAEELVNHHDAVLT